MGWSSSNWDASYWDGSNWDHGAAGDGSATGQLAVTFDDVVLAATGTFTPAAGTSQPGSTGPLRRKRWKAPTPRVGRVAVTLDGATFTAHGTTKPPAFIGRFTCALDGATLTARGVTRPPLVRSQLAATLASVTLAACATVRKPSPIWHDHVDEEALALVLLA